MITELIRDNRKIVDRISQHDIDGMVRLVKEKNVSDLIKKIISLRV